jgi:uncharacterized protein (TIGR03435 family)
MRTVLALLALSICLLAQTAGPSFDGASIKISPPLDSSSGPVYFGEKGGPETDDPGRYTCNFCSIGGLVSQAYDVPEYRLASANRLPREQFHVIATIPRGTTREQFRLMLQNLLAERFKLVAHREPREMQTFRLVVAPGGPTLKAHVEGEAPPPAANTNPANRVPGVYYRVQGKTIAEFAKLVEAQLQRRVTDATGLGGKYDFDLWWSEDLDADPSAPADRPTIRSAIQSLGLKLETLKTPLDVVVVDRVEKLPVENQTMWRSLQAAGLRLSRNLAVLRCDRTRLLTRAARKRNPPIPSRAQRAPRKGAVPIANLVSAARDVAVRDRPLLFSTRPAERSVWTPEVLKSG